MFQVIITTKNDVKVKNNINIGSLRIYAMNAKKHPKFTNSARNQETKCKGHVNK